MKKSGTIFSIPSLLLLLLLSIFPILKILIEVKKISSSILSYGIIGYLFLIILLCIVILIQFIYLLTSLYKSDEKIIFKIIWTLIILLLNIFIFPYFYNRHILKKDNIIASYILFLIPTFLFIGVFFFGYNVYEEQLQKIEEERIKIEQEKNVYKSKDGSVEFTFGHGYEVKDIGEYDLYVINEDKNIVFTSFTYDTYYYEQKTADDFIEKGIKDVSLDKEEFKVFKEKETLELDDKTITTVSYEGKTSTSSKCIYKISAISFREKSNFIVYVVEVTTKTNYEKDSDELLNILKSAKNY